MSKKLKIKVTEEGMNAILTDPAIHNNENSNSVSLLLIPLRAPMMYSRIKSWDLTK